MAITEQNAWDMWLTGILGCRPMFLAVYWWIIAAFIYVVFRYKQGNRTLTLSAVVAPAFFAALLGYDRLRFAYDAFERQDFRHIVGIVEPVRSLLISVALGSGFTFLLTLFLWFVHDKGSRRR